MHHNGDQEQAKRRKNTLLRVGSLLNRMGVTEGFGSPSAMNRWASATEAGEIVRWEGKQHPRSWTCHQTGWTSRQHLQGRIHCSYSFWTKAKQGPCAIITVHAYLTRPICLWSLISSPCWGQYLVQGSGCVEYSGCLMDGSRLVYTLSSTPELLTARSRIILDSKGHRLFCVCMLETGLQRWYWRDTEVFGVSSKSPEKVPEEAPSPGLCKALLELCLIVTCMGHFTVSMSSPELDFPLALAN